MYQQFIKYEVFFFFEAPNNANPPCRRFLHTGFDVVAREQPCHAVHDALVPTVVVLLDDVDRRTLRKRQLILLVLDVIVDSNH